MMKLGTLFMSLLLAFCVKAIGHEIAAGEDYGPAIPVEKVPGTGGAMAVQVADGLLYVLGSGRLSVFDISEPAKPKLLGSRAGLGNVRQLAVRNGRAYIAAREYGLWILDVGNPQSIEILSRFDTVEMATGIALSGNTAFIAMRVYGIETVDVSDPAKPRHLSLTPTAEAQSVRVGGQRLLAGNWAAGTVDLFDIESPGTPRRIGQIRLDGYGDGVDIAGNLCFAATGHHAKTGPRDRRDGRGHGLEIFDISSPAAPRKLSGVKFPALFNRFNDFWMARVSGPRHVFVADTHNGVFLLEVSDPEKPRFAGRIELPYQERFKMPDAVSGLAVGDGVLYLTGVRSGLYLARLPGIARLSEPEPESVQTPAEAAPMAADPAKFFQYNVPGGQVRGIALKDEVIYAACGQAGLHVLRMTGNGPELLKAWNFPEVYDVRIRGDILYAAEGSGGVAAYRIGSNFELQLLSRLPLPNGELAQLIRIPGDGRFALVSSRKSKLFFLDLTDSGRPVQVWEHRQIGLQYGDMIADGLLAGQTLVNWHSGGLAWYDLQGEKPQLGAALTERFGNHLDGAAVLGDQFLFVFHKGYLLLDPGQTGPSADWRRHSVPGLQLTGIPTVDGSMAAFSDRIRRQVTVVDFRDPLKPLPVPERHYRLAGTPGTVAFLRGKLIIPAGHQGLLLER